MNVWFYSAKGGARYARELGAAYRDIQAGTMYRRRMCAHLHTYLLAWVGRLIPDSAIMSVLPWMPGTGTKEDWLAHKFDFKFIPVFPRYVSDHFLS